MTARHRLLLRTHDGQSLTVLPNVISWEFVRTANDVGWFSITLDADFDRRFLGIDNIVEFWRQPAGASETLLGIGFIRYWEWNTDDQGKSSLRIGGPDPIELLERRIIQNFAETAYSEKGPDYCDDIIKQIVREQYVTTTNRHGDLYYSRSSAMDPAHFSVAPDLSGGYANGKIQGGWRIILPLLQQLAETSWNQGTRIYFDFDYTGPAVLLFQTWADIRGIDRTIGSDIAPVIFSLESGNISNPTLRFDYTEEVNFCHGGGQGQGDEREVDPENDEPRSQLSIWNRREAFQDARECPLDESPTYCIANRAFDRMQSGRPKVIFDGSLLNTPTTRFGVDWGYGDKVTVQYKGYEFDGRADQFTVKMNHLGVETVTSRVSILEAIEGHPD